MSPDEAGIRLNHCGFVVLSVKCEQNPILRITQQEQEITPFSIKDGQTLEEIQCRETVKI